jgi:hypothetical protein
MALRENDFRQGQAFGTLRGIIKNGKSKINMRTGYTQPIRPADCDTDSWLDAIFEP